MEVSSQGIANKRIEGILYDYAIFTNLSHEHLDTHKTMHNYFLTKLKLFKQLKKQGIMIVNKDDYYAKFFEKYSNVIYYSLFSPSDYQAIHIRYYQNHTVFDLKAKDFVLENLSRHCPGHISSPWHPFFLYGMTYQSHYRCHAAGGRPRIVYYSYPFVL